MAHHKGEKFKGPHTAHTDISAKISDIATQLEEVTRISFGVPSRGSVEPKVRIENIQGGLLLKVYKARSAQELRVYGKDIPKIKSAIMKALVEKNIPIYL